MDPQFTPMIKFVKVILSLISFLSKVKAKIEGRSEMIATLQTLKSLIGTGK